MDGTDSKSVYVTLSCGNRVGKSLKVCLRDIVLENRVGKSLKVSLRDIVL